MMARRRTTVSCTTQATALTPYVCRCLQGRVKQQPRRRAASSGLAGAQQPHIHVCRAPELHVPPALCPHMAQQHPEHLYPFWVTRTSTMLGRSSQAPSISYSPRAVAALRPARPPAVRPGGAVPFLLAHNMSSASFLPQMSFQQWRVDLLLCCLQWVPRQPSAVCQHPVLCRPDPAGQQRRLQKPHPCVSGPHTAAVVLACMPGGMWRCQSAAKWLARVYLTPCNALLLPAPACSYLKAQGSPPCPTGPCRTHSSCCASVVAAVVASVRGWASWRAVVPFHGPFHHDAC